MYSAVRNIPDLLRRFSRSVYIGNGELLKIARRKQKNAAECPADPERFFAFSVRARLHAVKRQKYGHQYKRAQKRTRTVERKRTNAVRAQRLGYERRAPGKRRKQQNDASGNGEFSLRHRVLPLSVVILSSL